MDILDILHLPIGNSIMKGLFQILLTPSKIDDIAFEFLVLHCFIGRGIRQEKIPQEKLLCRKFNVNLNHLSLLGAPTNKNAFGYS